jgi:predicted RNA methylase
MSHTGENQKIFEALLLFQRHNFNALAFERRRYTEDTCTVQLPVILHTSAYSHRIESESESETETYEAFKFHEQRPNLINNQFSL